MTYIKGNFVRYIFKSDNGFSVGVFKIKETNLNITSDTITFTGYFTELNEIDSYVFEGELVNHFKYGEQFNVSSYEVLLPSSKDKIISFLSSEIFKGIGKKKAEKIVDVLGEDALNKILLNKDVLKQAKIKDKDIDIIYNSLNEYKENYDKMIKLTEVGFSVKDALKIEKYYQSEIDLALSSPYEIIDVIPDITFSKIDKLRDKFNIPKYNLNRVKQGIIYVMEELSFRKGDTYFYYDEIINFAINVLGVSKENIDDGIKELLKENKLIIDGEKYILMEVYESELYIAERLKHLNSDFSNDNYDEEISFLEEKLGCSFNEEQKTAINKALNFNTLVITGGPGTGKTTIIKAITSIYQNINKLTRQELINDLVLLAPTGRASKRMSENAHLPSYTIHRFLKWQKEENKFLINEENKSTAKMVIIDEVSMLDTNLFYNLLLGLSLDCKIIMIGDYNQLPSVGAGQVLKDIIESDFIPVVSLKKLYRQSSMSNINYLAHDVISGKLDLSIFNESDDLTFVECNSSNLKDVLGEFILAYKDLSIYDIEVLAPIYKGENGIDKLNEFIRDILNKNKNLNKSLTHGDVTYYENDKIIELVNNLDDNVFNGDIGKIISINKGKEKEVLCEFDDNIVNFKSSSFDNFKLGYAISIHKAQGSEFKVVIIPVLNSYSYMLYRKIIYTAITRAKEKLILLGEISALQKAILTDRENERKTMLKKFLSS